MSGVQLGGRESDLTIPECVLGFGHHGMENGLKSLFSFRPFALRHRRTLCRAHAQQLVARTPFYTLYSTTVVRVLRSTVPSACTELRSSSS